MLLGDILKWAAQDDIHVLLFTVAVIWLSLQLHRRFYYRGQEKVGRTGQMCSIASFVLPFILAIVLLRFNSEVHQDSQVPWYWGEISPGAIGGVSHVVGAASDKPNGYGGDVYIAVLPCEASYGILHIKEKVPERRRTP